MSAVHSSKTLYPIDVTEKGMLTEVREVQKENVDEPIAVTEGGMVIEVMEVQ